MGSIRVRGSERLGRLAGRPAVVAEAVVSGLLRLEPCRRLGLGELASHAWLRDATDAAADALEGSVAEERARGSRRGRTR